MNVGRWKLIICFLVIGVLEILYGITRYQSDKQVILQSQTEMLRAKHKKESLEIEKESITDIEKELHEVTTKKQAYINRIPDYKAHSEQMAEWMRYMSCYDFSNISFQTIESEEDEGIESIINEHYELCFVGKYDEIVEFIEYLNASNQMLRICQVDFSNEVQDLEVEENKQFLYQYGEDVSEIVQATIELCFYIKDEMQSKQEIYHSDFTIERNNESLFKWNPTHSDEETVFVQEEMEAVLANESQEGEREQGIN